MPILPAFLAACGLTGEQGVLIPATNVKHLMLRRDVVEAAEQGRFQIYAVENIDQAIALQTGMSAGDADASGNYSGGGVNSRVAARMAKLSEIRKSFARQAKKSVKKGGEASRLPPAFGSDVYLD